MKKSNKLRVFWPKDIFLALRLNILTAMLGGFLFFAADAAVWNMGAYAITKGLATVILIYALASAIILKKKAVDKYY